MRASSPDPRGVAPADLAACGRLLRGGSRTFFAASLLLPPSIRQPAAALYAFCRLADDAIDLASGSGDVVTALRQRLDRAYAGQPLPIAADRAFAEVVIRFGVPRALPEALLEGFAWDAAGRRYDDLAALNAYAARVAGSVGAMMAIVMGRRTRDAVARACDLGVAMQLSNIARDVGEDARAGRLYLPRQWLAEAGIDADAWLRRPVFSAALGSVVQRLLREAELLYDRAESGIGLLPKACRPGIRVARRLYAEIGREVERSGFDSVSRRAVVPFRSKALLVASTLAAMTLPSDRRSAPPLAETSFLVDAVMAAPLPAGRIYQPPAQPAWWNVDERAAWLIGLFERLERLDETRLRTTPRHAAIGEAQT
jgi:15-cis-phytoene synthase